MVKCNCNTIVCPVSGDSYPVRSAEGLHILKRYLSAYVHVDNNSSSQTGGLFESRVHKIVTITWETQGDFTYSIQIPFLKQYFQPATKNPPTGYRGSKIHSSHFARMQTWIQNANENKSFQVQHTDVPHFKGVFRGNEYGVVELRIIVDTVLTHSFVIVKKFKTFIGTRRPNHAVDALLSKIAIQQAPPIGTHHTTFLK